MSDSNQERKNELGSDRGKKLTVIQLGRAAYEPVLDVQKQQHRERVEGNVPDRLLFVEHEPVYTLGKAADPDHLVASDRFLRNEGIDVVEVERGGDVTYHGPGQVVGYPVLDLREHRRSISWYMRSLEETIIRTLETFGIESTREEGRPGVWVDQEKICAVGVRIARWVTYHGFALNVDPEMDHFEGIIPCGISDAGVVSMSDLLSPVPDPAEIRRELTSSFRNIFGFDEPHWKRLNPVDVQVEEGTDEANGVT